MNNNVTYKYLDSFLQSIGDESSDKLIYLYDEIPNSLLKLIFSSLHFNINSLFSFLNLKLISNGNNGHYNAAESRQLLDILDKINELKINLSSSDFGFGIDPYYNNLFTICSKFLSQKCGSKIPDNFEKINLLLTKPLFILTNSISRNSTTYITLKQIGSGSYANVYKYKDELYDKYFAVKRLKKEHTEKELIRFKEEYNYMKKLKSPYILEVYNYTESKNEYIMEYADITLFEYITKYNTQLSLQERLSLVNQLFKAINYLHKKNILHRDISLSNILIKKYDDIAVIKISDFGLIKIPNSSLTSKSSEIKGALNDPSLVNIGFQNYKIIHEVYSLTQVINFIISGKTTINKIENLEFKNFINKGLDADYNKRYQSIDEMFTHFKTIKF